MIQTAVILGAGNLATQLAQALIKNGVTIIEIYSRTEKSAQALATKVKTKFTTHINTINQTADIYILATSDSAHQSVLNALKFKPKRLVHTAGSVSYQILDGYGDETGVFYPFQTFSKNKDVCFKTIPILVESESTNLVSDLKQLGLRLSERVDEMDSATRKLLHVSAVFACNFVNHLYDLSHQLTQLAGIDFDLLQPLIQETAQKIKVITPREAQTGPAVRMDQRIISEQEALLNEKCPDLVAVYQLLSQSIFNYANKQNR